MTRLKQILCVISCFLWLPLCGCGQLIQPKVTHPVAEMRAGAYKIDPTHTTVLFKVNHLGLSTFVGRFNKVEASLDFDSKNLANSKLSAIIDINSLDINNPALAKTLMDDDWFDAKQFPKASFVTRSVKVIDNNHAEFLGDFVFRGVSRPLTVWVSFNGAADNILTGRYTLGFDARSSFKRSDFGMDYLIPAVSDQIEIEVFAEFQKN